MPKSLSIVTYTRGNHPVTGKVQPYHWSFFVLKDTPGNQRLGIAHQLRGMPGAFYYMGPEEVDLNKSQSKKEELEIGEVPDDKLNEIEAILKACPIDISESSGWNCQDWTLTGLEALKSRGWVESHFTSDVVKTWLKET